MSELKYKAGDRVRIKSLDWYNENKNEFGDVKCSLNCSLTKSMSIHCGSIQTIESVVDGGMYWMKENPFNWTDEMIEGLVEEETKFGTAANPLEIKSNANSIIQSEVDVIEKAKTYWDSIKDAWVCPEGYVFKDENGNVINAQKIVLEKKRKEYPKTFEECVRVLEGESRMSLEQMNTFRRLIDARNAYWKIAGEEMGLGKPWEPDWNTSEPKYVIACTSNGIEKQWETTYCKGFAFPTEEMRDAFNENFDPDIEFCKEFL